MQEQVEPGTRDALGQREADAAASQPVSPEHWSQEIPFDAAVYLDREVPQYAAPERAADADQD